MDAGDLTITMNAGELNAETDPAALARRSLVLPTWLATQQLNLERHVSALRDFTREEFGTGPESPTEGQVQAVNELLTKLRSALVNGAHHMSELVEQATLRPTPRSLEVVVKHKSNTHRWVRRIEQIWDFYLELFGQRQSSFGEWLVGTDRIALDCYQYAYMGLGCSRSVPSPAPFSYMRTGFGPATYRRGIKMSKLGSESNPFPLIQLPYHRLVNPWTLGAILHEVSHNLQSDLGLTRVTAIAIGRRLLDTGIPRTVAQVWVRWNREIFADLSGLLLGGPAVVESLMDVVGLAPEIVTNFNPEGVHPIPYLRVPLSLELLRRMGFRKEAEEYGRAWFAVYSHVEDSIPRELAATAARAIPVVVDTVCYQPFKELGGKQLSQLYCCGQKEQRMIEETANRLGKGIDPGIVPERFLIGAARFAIDHRLASPDAIRENFYRELARR